MTMDNTTVGVLVTMEEDVSTKMPAVTDSLVKSRSAMRELSMGTGYLSSMMLSMGVAMKASNNATMQGMSSMLMMVGGIGMAVTNAARFINALGRMTSALQKFNVAQLIANLLSGPAGWAKLLVGGALVGGAAYGITKMMTAGPSGRQAPTTKIDVHVAGSVVTDRQLTDGIQRGLLLKSQRNAGTGIR